MNDASQYTHWLPRDAAARHWFMHTRHTAIGMGQGKAGSRLLPDVSDERLARKGSDPVSPAVLRVNVLPGFGPCWETAAERLVRHLNTDAQIIAQRPWAGGERKGEGERGRRGDDSGFRSPALPFPPSPPLPFSPSSVGDRECLLLLGWPAADDRQRLKEIELYCRGGGPLVAVRTLDAEMPGWPNFAEEVFGARQGALARSQLMEVVRSDVAWHHPIVERVEVLLAEGEVYRGPRLGPRATVLLTADDGRGPAPAAWATRQSGGRVFCTTLGHEDDFREPTYLRLLANAVRWVAAI